MKKIIQFFLAAILLPATLVGNAAVLDFEDLALGNTYFVGDNFVTGGIPVLASDFFFFPSGTAFAGGRADVVNLGLANGAGNEMGINNINLNFNFGSGIPGLSMLFGEFGGNLNIDVNGAFMNFEDFSQLNGTSLGGVSILALNGLGNDQGVLTLNGTITSFMIGGQELWIDNISIIPVPAAVWLFATALVGLVELGRRKKAA